MDTTAPFVPVVNKNVKYREMSTRAFSGLIQECDKGKLTWEDGPDNSEAGCVLACVLVQMHTKNKAGFAVRPTNTRSTAWLMHTHPEPNLAYDQPQLWLHWPQRRGPAQR